MSNLLILGMAVKWLALLAAGWLGCTCCGRTGSEGGTLDLHCCLEKTTKRKKTLMNHKFDELAKGLAQSVTRRQALKKSAS